MNAIAKLLPRRDKVAALEAELAALCAKGAGLLEDLESRRAVLAACEDDHEVLAASGRVTVAMNRLRKVEAEIAQLRQEITLARDAARLQQHKDLRAAYAKIFRDFLAAADELLGKSKNVLEAREALYLAGFRVEHEAAPRLPAIGTMLAFDADVLGRIRSDLAQFAAADRYLAPEVYTSDPALAAAAASAQERASAKAREAAAALPPKLEAAPEPQVQASIRVTLHPNPAPWPPRRAALQEVVGAGEYVVTVLRDGVEMPGKGQLLAGDEVALPIAAIAPLLRTGAVDLKHIEDLAALRAEPGAEGAAA